MCNRGEMRQINGLLKKIIENKMRELDKKRMLWQEISQKKQLCNMRNFQGAIKKGNFSIIGEIKQMSPVSGIITNDFHPEKIARVYEKSGIDAISVLTDKRFFGGDDRHILLVKTGCKLPVLRKEFIIDEFQVYESSYLGADAILLIARILSLQELRQFLILARRLGMVCLVEVHSESDLKKVFKTDAEIIGVNNRNLKDFTVDIRNSLSLRKKIPDTYITISESGIRNYNDIRMLRDAGFDGALIGTAILRTDDIRKKIRELRGWNG